MFEPGKVYMFKKDLYLADKSIRPGNYTKWADIHDGHQFVGTGEVSRYLNDVKVYPEWCEVIG